MTKNAGRRKAVQNRPNKGGGDTHKSQAAQTPMNFRVSEEFHREFKTYAAQHSKKMVEVLQDAFNLLKERGA